MNVPASGVAGVGSGDVQRGVGGHVAAQHVELGHPAIGVDCCSAGVPSVRVIPVVTFVIAGRGDPGEVEVDASRRLLDPHGVGRVAVAVSAAVPARATRRCVPMSSSAQLLVGLINAARGMVQ